MTTPDVPARTSPTASISPASSAGTPAVAAPASRRWLLGALLLAGAAQLITISALVSADPLAVTWYSLLLAIAPAPVAAVAVSGPAQVRLLAAAADVLILVACRHAREFLRPAAQAAMLPEGKNPTGSLARLLRVS